MQEAILNVFPFRFYLLWNEKGELLKLKVSFSISLNSGIEYKSSSKVLRLINNFWEAFLDYWNFKKSRVEVAHSINFTKFESKIFEKLTKLEIGEIITYKELAKRVGFEKAYRAVARALAKNPLPLVYPCHRIIGNKGLMGFSQGILIKQFLIYREIGYIQNFDI